MASVVSAQAIPFTAGTLAQVSGSTPFPPGCGGPGEAGSFSFNYADSEVETHVAVNPSNPNNVVAFWQQDRWNDGGAHGLLASYSQDGGATWTSVVVPGLSECAGGDFERATDPWLSFSPNGRLHAIALVFDNSTARNAILATYSNDGGATWATPRTVRYDNPRASGNSFNDKQTLTADPYDANRVYATWQRLVSPSEQTSAKGYERATSYYSTAWFAKSVDGGQTWQPARSIYADRGKLTQTIGNQVEVLPDGTLINGFDLIRQATNRDKTRGTNVALVRSRDGGDTWSREIVVNSLRAVQVRDPESGWPVRTGDILPDWAVDRGANEATRGNVYVVWMDARYNDPGHNDILLARSTDGGRTWGEPVVVDETPLGVDAFTPMVDVDSSGRVAVTYYDFRNDVTGDGALSTDFWAARSDDGGATFGDETRLTTSPFDMVQAPYAGGYFVGDYTGLDHAGTTFHAAWVGGGSGAANPTDVFHRTFE